MWLFSGLLLICLLLRCVCGGGDFAFDSPVIPHQSDVTNMMEEFQRKIVHKTEDSLIKSTTSLMMTLYHEKNNRSTSDIVHEYSLKKLNKRERRALKRANTVRSVICQGSHRKDRTWTLNFSLKELPVTERFVYAEVQFKGPDFIQDIDDLRLKVSGISQSINLANTKLKMNKKNKLDVTKQLRNMKPSSFKHSEAEHMKSAQLLSDITLIIFSKGDDAQITEVAIGRTARNRRDSLRERRRKNRNKLHSDEYMSKRIREKQSGVDNDWTEYHHEMIPCGKVPAVVDFNKIGWDEWIIYPKKYQAYRCEGRCNMASLHGSSPSNHAFIQSYYSAARPELGIPEACCVPTELKPMSLLYFESGNIVQRDHEDMIVAECGCR